MEGVTPVAVLVVVLVLATSFGLWRRATDGRLRPSRGSGPARGEAENVRASDDRPSLGPDELGAPLGERVTLVQFSSAFCQPCSVTRGVLSQVSSTDAGVVHLELDVADRLDLARSMGIMRTPTTLILDNDGREVARASGVPSLAAVRGAVAAIQ